MKPNSSTRPNELSENNPARQEKHKAMRLKSAAQ